MSQINPLIRNTQQNIYEDASASLGYSIYPSPDKYRQNSIGLNISVRNNVPPYINNQKLIMEEQNMLNNLKYNSEMLNNLELLDEFNNSENRIPQEILYQNYLSQQDPMNMNLQQQKSIMVYGNITPISPNHNKLIANRGLINDLSVNTNLIDRTSFISDINSPTFKSNINVIQQQSSEIMNNMNSNILSSLSLPKIEAINDGKMNLLSNPNASSAEVNAVSTLLAPKSHPSSTPLLTDVIIPSESYTTTHSSSYPTSENYTTHSSSSFTTLTQDSIMTPIQTTPLNLNLNLDSLNAQKINSSTFSQNYPKMSHSFYSPALSPAISQIYPHEMITNQAKVMSTAQEPHEINNFIKKANSLPLIKTTLKKKITKPFNSSISTSNHLKSINPLFIKTDHLTNKQNKKFLNSQMDIDVPMKDNEKSVLEKKEALFQNSSSPKNKLSADTNVDKSSKSKLLLLKDIKKKDMDVDVTDTSNNSKSLETKNSLPSTEITKMDIVPLAKEEMQKNKNEIKQKMTTTAIKENSDMVKENEIDISAIQLTSEKEEQNGHHIKTFINSKMEDVQKKEKISTSVEVVTPKTSIVVAKIPKEKKDKDRKSKVSYNKVDNKKKEKKSKDVAIKSKKELKEEIKGQKESKVEIKDQKESKAEIKDQKESMIEIKDQKESMIEIKDQKETKAEIKDQKETKAEIKDQKELKIEIKDKKESLIEKIASTKELDSNEDNIDPLIIKKRPRFSMKKAKNDPAAIAEHELLKRKRNTEAARRSRQRKLQQMRNLEETVASLTKKLEETKNELKSYKEKYEKILEESNTSKNAYESKIKALEEQLKQNPFELRR